MKRVFVLLLNEDCHDTGRLCGIFNYVRESGVKWDLRHVFRDSGGAPDSLLDGWIPDGVIMGSDASCDYFSRHADKLSGCRVIRLSEADPKNCSDPGLLPPGTFSSVYIDNFSIGRMGADYLLKKRFPNYAFVGSQKSAVFDKLRIDGFSDAMKKAGKKFRYAEFESPDIKEWLAKLPKPCGIMVSYDYIGLLLLRFCAEMSLEVPDSISVVGVGDFAEICDYSRPRLSSINIRSAHMGYIAAKLLDELLSGTRKRNTHIPFNEFRVVERTSSRWFPARYMTAARAREYIASHACDNGFTVNRVAEFLGCSLRFIETTFLETFDRTMADEIQTRKIETAKKILENSSVPIDEIAGFCGYDDGKYLKRIFKAKTGMTMRDWRKTRG